MLAAIFWVSLLGTVWVYALYPASLAVLGRVAARPRRRCALEVPLTLVIAAHDEEEVIEAKIRNVRAVDYPPALVAIVVASDGSTDRTVERARRAGADVVLNLPRVGKITALNRAAEHAAGEILVFTDADSLFEADTLRHLTANFCDDGVGGVSANEVSGPRGNDRAVARGEGLYWRYEQWIKRLEDRVGSVVSASGRLYAIRRSLFVPSSVTTGTDDFVISTGVVRAGHRLAFDPLTRVVVDTPAEDGPELRRKVRVMNRGLRAALSARRHADPLLGRWLRPAGAVAQGAEAASALPARGDAGLQRGAGHGRADLAPFGVAADRVLWLGACRMVRPGPALWAHQGLVHPLLLLPGQPGGRARGDLFAARSPL